MQNFVLQKDDQATDQHKYSHTSEANRKLEAPFFFKPTITQTSESIHAFSSTYPIKDEAAEPIQAQGEQANSCNLK